MHAARSHELLLLTDQRARRLFYYCREGTPQDASSNPYRFSLLSPGPEPASGVVVHLFCYWVVALSVLSRTVIHYSHTTDIGTVNCSFPPPL